MQEKEEKLSLHPGEMKFLGKAAGG
jgi:hypothetical protein